MALSFAHYLLQNNYKQEQITILSLYSSQALEIVKLANKKDNWEMPLDNVRITTVDNYQGEENDIIIISVVRSNRDNVIGFLKSANRINVALSRARNGLYIFGNADCLAHAAKKS